MILGPDWNISEDGWPVLALAGICTIVMSIISLPIGGFFLGIMVWMAFLLRVPNRNNNADDQTIYAPCDGVVLEIVSDIFPDGLSNDSEPAKRITIQTRLSDTQLQTSPITGHIVENNLMPGLFSKWGDNSASWRAARLVNERREIRFRDRFKRDVVLVQMGSKTARRLVCRLVEGKFLRAGSPIGMACVAGVVDLYMPARSRIRIAAGQHTIAGETILAQFASKPALRQQNSLNQE